MSKTDCKPTQELVKELFFYSPETGFLTRKKTLTYNAKAGDVLKTVNNMGYVTLNVAGKRYLAHRLIWLYVHGTWPKHEIDHINGLRHDNRLDNLRDVSHQANLNNQRLNKRNKYNCRGVTFQKNAQKFCVNFRHFGVRHYLGLFDTLEAAKSAYGNAILSLTQKEIHE